MSKIYKQKDKLVVYLPFDVVNTLALKEGDEVGFHKHSGKYFIFAKDSDVVQLLTNFEGGNQPVATAAPTPVKKGTTLDVSEEELAVLRKLDTLRYNDRTKDKIKQLLNPKERKIFLDLMKKKYVAPFKKAGETVSKFGIAKNVYDKFLYGKRQMNASSQRAQIEASRPAQQVAQPRKWEATLNEGNPSVATLEANGFIVLQNQAEAASLSAALEESIRHGLVVGTRAFNKKYYIALKAFVARNAMKVMKSITEKSKNVSEISKETGIDEDGIRAILYVMSESGDVTEVRRDVFKTV